MKPLILVHGGAGAMRSMDGERAAAYRAGLVEAARVGRELLAAGGSALDAVVVATRVMEASGAFNAGVGSCLDAEGRYSLDAALMDGRERRAGALGAVTATAHPIDAARALLDEGRHVLLVGPGADRWIAGLELPPLPEPPADKLAHYEELLAKQAARQRALDLADMTSVGRPDDEEAPDLGHDTVGAVALDAEGGLAAAVSTGGLWLKAPGRVGDSALVGAGLFACETLGAAAVSTGIGERMIRDLTCHRACQLSQELGAQEGAEGCVAELDQRFGPDSGGVIVVDAQGLAGASFNTQGMGRALARVGEEEIPVAVWPEDDFPL
ncbi:MAG TPA: beta-aspartyl-peptidase [Planctomycetes bacterium]|nr:beta-aspartyl-peptidase [Planctomycetota bacterium]